MISLFADLLNVSLLSHLENYEYIAVRFFDQCRIPNQKK
jgi:hypothetical protein